MDICQQIEPGLRIAEIGHNPPIGKSEMCGFRPVFARSDFPLCSNLPQYHVDAYKQTFWHSVCSVPLFSLDS